MPDGQGVLGLDLGVVELDLLLRVESECIPHARFGATAADLLEGDAGQFAGEEERRMQRLACHDAKRVVPRLFLEQHCTKHAAIHHDGWPAPEGGSRLSHMQHGARR